MALADLLSEFTAAVETGNGARLAAIFTPDGIYHDTFYGEFQGPVAIKAMLEDYFWRDGDGFKWDMLDPIDDGRHGYARWLFSYRSKVKEAPGKRVVFEGIGHFDLVDGRIRRYGEVFDIGIALAQLEFAPERVAKIVARAAGRLRERVKGSPHLPA
ncbi:MAG: nuclear transport factor 2 family protein [Alphaproteobacteria bacterium]|nr:nuclear transport factor 2 family protein [Alphaproteobacteria bacterium]